MNSEMMLNQIQSQLADKFSKDEIKNILHVLSGYSIKKTIAAVIDRDKALVEFLYNTGCRVSEVAKLQRTDIKFAEKTCTAQGKDDKYRKVYINAKTELTLSRYFQNRKDKNKVLFVSLRSLWPPLSKADIKAAIKRLKDAFQVEKNVTPHIFRYTTAIDAL